MASASRRDTASLRDRLESEARRFEFLQAVRLLQRAAPDRERIGGDGDPRREAVRLRSEVSLTFPRSDVVKIEPPAEPGGPPELTVAFLGVATSNSFGSLPTAYVEQIIQQEKSEPPVLRDFFDCFNHRIGSLYYRAFERGQLALAHESGSHNFFEAALRGVLGLGTLGLRDRLTLPDEALFSRAGLLAMAPLPAAVLENLIESYFGAPARVEQFVRAWYPLDPEDLSRLGTSSAALGVDLALGTTVQLSQFRFRVRVGPLSLERYESMLPKSDGFEALFDLIRLATNPEQTFEVRLVLRKEELPPLELSATSSCRLGWTTWLAAGEGPRERDADDAIFASESCVLVHTAPRSLPLEEAA